MKNFIAITLLLCSTHLGALTVQDDARHPIQLTQPAQRIVSLAPHITELLFSVGAGAQVIAVSAHSDFPKAARHLPSVGSYLGLDIERIVALKPDLVIAWQSGNPAGQIERLERFGIRVFRSEPKTFEDITSTLERFGRLTGHTALGLENAAAFRQQVSTLRQQYAHRPKVRVFYQIMQQPLMTVGGEHLISKAIDLCAGINIFATLQALAPQVNLETVIGADPQVIVAAAVSGVASIDWSLWQQWPQIAAVKNRHLVEIDAAFITRPTMRFLQGTEQLCRMIDAARQNH